jgi:hypothetical protein
MTVSAFRVTRVPPLLGRTFVEADEDPGCWLTFDPGSIQIGLALGDTFLVMLLVAESWWRSRFWGCSRAYRPARRRL